MPRKPSKCRRFVNRGKVVYGKVVQYSDSRDLPAVGENGDFPVAFDKRRSVASNRRRALQDSARGSVGSEACKVCCREFPLRWKGMTLTTGVLNASVALGRRIFERLIYAITPHLRR